MKKFEYPNLDVQCVSSLPDGIDCCFEWADESSQAIVQANLKGERRLRTFTEQGICWSYAKASKQNGAFELLTLARALVAGGVRSTDTSIAIMSDRFELMDALLSALLASVFQLPHFKQGEVAVHPLKIFVVGEFDNQTLATRLAEAEGNAYVRYLASLPANELNPWSYRELIEELADNEDWECRVYRYKELERMGAGAFLAVARGSEKQEASIVRLHYKGDPDSIETISLVGKGVTMDTGGYNLKVGGSMFGMNVDMAGSAVVLGSLLAATRRQEKINLTGWLAITDNHVGPNAYSANEWVRALNGTTIEVVDTDAEGRMILADTLTLASREHPKAVFDYATLTGACVAALSTRYSGVFTNHEPWFLPLIEAGKQSGERIWPFPIDVDYDENIKSSVADVQQCNPGKSSDHIDAARFLSRFIEPNVPWVHVDLAAARHKGGLAHVPTDVTGFGVRLTQTMVKMLF